MIPCSGDLPYPGIKLGSPALQVNALPSEPPGKPCWNLRYYNMIVSLFRTMDNKFVWNVQWCFWTHWYFLPFAEHMRNEGDGIGIVLVWRTVWQMYIWMQFHFWPRWVNGYWTCLPTWSNDSMGWDIWSNSFQALSNRHQDCDPWEKRTHEVNLAGNLAFCVGTDTRS